MKAVGLETLRELQKKAKQRNEALSSDSAGQVKELLNHLDCETITWFRYRDGCEF
jgi:hypothetical protein